MEVGNFSALDGFLVALAIVVAGVMLRRKVRDAPFWRATVTPLASIIGSGFLIVAPLLAGVAGTFALEAMIGIVLLSLWVGAAVRFNILHDGINPLAEMARFAPRLERMSDVALAFAYAISIAFYIRLMSGFVLTAFNAFTTFNADVLATLVLSFIGIYGLRRGLYGLERLEEYSVTVKLAIVAALLTGMVYHDAGNGYDLTGLPTPASDYWDRLRQLGGMLLIVQGFETSKYLSSTYDRQLRVRSMHVAQLLAGVIYVLFAGLAMPLMAPFAHAKPSETAIIGLSGAITLVLPMMLVLAAVMSQFSAAIADTIGAGGVIENETRRHVPAQTSYLVITLMAAALLWVTNIFEVVTLASRAFAFYYLLQAVLAARLAAETGAGWRRRWLTGSYWVLAIIMLAIVLFARPVAA